MKSPLSDKQKSKLLALSEIAEHGDLAVVTQMFEMQDTFDTKTEELDTYLLEVKAIFEKIDLNQFRGEPGKDADPVDYDRVVAECLRLTPPPPKPKAIREQRIIAEVMQLIPIPKYGDDADEERVIAEVLRRIVLPEAKEVMLDTPEEIVEKVNTSKKRIKKVQVEGLDELERMVQANAHSSSLPQTTSFVNGKRAKNFSFSGSAVASVEVRGDTAYIVLTGGVGGGQVNSIVAGDGIDVDDTDPANPIVSATASGGFTELTATGSVNSSNVTFTFSQEPSYVVADGLWLKKLDSNGGTQWSGTTTVTMVSPPSNSIFGIA